MTKSRDRAWSFLREALDSTATLDQQKIESLLKPVPVPEGVYIDYKRGEWLQRDRKLVTADLRKWVASFANADGGTLVIGVADSSSEGEGVPAWTITACAPQEPSLYDWVTSMLHDLRMLRPVVHVVQTPGARLGNEVVVIAVARFHRIVPCIEQGVETYYLRHGATTVRADTWLLRDLFLGRRARPHFVPCEEVDSTDPAGGHLDRRYCFGGAVAVENASPVWATKVHVTVIGLWANGTTISSSAYSGVRVATRGLGKIALVVPEASDGSSPPWDIPPFGRVELRFRIEALDDPSLRGDWLVMGAVLLNTRDDLPRWMQLLVAGSTLHRGAAARLFSLEDGEVPAVFTGASSEFLDSNLADWAPTVVRCLREGF